VTSLAAMAALLTVLAADPPFVQPRDDDDRFLNLDPREPHGFGDFLQWKVFDQIGGKNRSSPGRAPVPTVAADPEKLRVPPAAGEGARITWLGHSSFLVQLDGVSLLVDPVLMERMGPMGIMGRNVPPALRPEDLPHIDACLVSHAHYDHMDLPTLRAVQAPVVAGLGNGGTLRGARLRHATLGWWQRVRIRGVEITFVPSQHFSNRTTTDGDRALWGGFIIRGSTATLYHSGDTAYFSGFKEIGRRFPGIDAAMLPVGAYDPRWFMSSVHVDPEEALQAFEDLGARTFVAMHWGTFKQADEPLDEPPVRVEAERVRRGLPADRVRVLAVGETLEVRRPAPGPAVAGPSSPGGAPGAPTSTSTGAGTP
jgi:L-ascorbate metabolism protein UlaG (beta-lactamase superfamily)